MGHANFSDLFIMKKEITNKTAVIINKAPFLSVSQIIWGKLAVRLANVAPIPSETKVTGKAQHKRVLREPKSEKKDKTLFTLYPRYFFCVITCISNSFFDLIICNFLF